MNDNPVNKAEKTRRFIIEKAAPIFNKKGIAGTSLADLTSATGLTKGSIYGNFKDKNDVAVAVFEYNVANITRYLEREMDQGDTWLERLMGLPRAYRRLHKKMIAYGGCPILNTATEADDTHAILCRMAAEAFENLEKNVRGILEDGLKAAEVLPGTDPQAASRIIIALIEGGGILAKVTGDGRYMADTLDHIESLIQAMAVQGPGALQE